MPESLIDKANRLLGAFLTSRGFVQTTTSGDPCSGWGASVAFESEELRIQVVRDRDDEGIYIESKIRLRPHVPLSRWPLGHLLAYLDKQADAYGVTSLETEARLLQERASAILDRQLLDSPELDRWANKASRRLFGQRPK